MKKIALSTLLALTLLLATNTQTTKAQHFEWGIRDGLSFSSLVGVEDSFPHVGLYAGFASNYFFNDTWGIGLDITLSEQGTFTYNGDTDVSMEYIYDYVNIPLMANYRIPLKNGSEIRIMAGAQLGVFLVGSYEYLVPSVLDGGNSLVEGSGFLDRDDFHPFDLGVTLGAQWRIIESPRVFLEARYTHGITQTHDGISNTLNGYYYISIPDNRNSVFQLGTVINF